AVWWRMEHQNEGSSGEQPPLPLFHVALLQLSYWQLQPRRVPTWLPPPSSATMMMLWYEIALGQNAVQERTLAVLRWRHATRGRTCCPPPPLLLPLLTVLSPSLLTALAAAVAAAVAAEAAH
ncbi:hypothetical protein Vretifemale_16407, partial [Volvox reticuliferus]